MKQKKSLFLAGSLLTSLTIVFMISNWLNKPRSQAPTGPKTESVLIAPDNLATGAIVTVAKMAWKDWLIDNIEPDYLTKKDIALLSEIDGGVVRTPIFKGEPIRTSKIIKTHGKSAIAAIIHEGMRAFTIPYSKLANAPSLIAPGDIVDIIIPKKTQGSGETYFGQTILTSVRVLAVNHTLQKSGGEEEKSNASAQTITLEVTAPQAEDLAGAIRDGQVVISMQSIFAKSAANKMNKPSETVPADVTESAPTKVITIMRGSEKKDMTFNKIGK